MALYGCLVDFKVHAMTERRRVREKERAGMGVGREGWEHLEQNVDVVFLAH